MNKVIGVLMLGSLITMGCDATKLAMSDARSVDDRRADGAALVVALPDASPPDAAPPPDGAPSLPDGAVTLADAAMALPDVLLPPVALPDVALPDAAIALPDAAVALPDATVPDAMVVVAPVPTQDIIFDGEPYTAYQRPGETFRILCHKPCPLSETYLFAKSAGIKAAKDKLIATTGIDVLPRNVPVDIHLATDPVCPPSSFTAYSSTFAAGGSYMCLFALEQSMPTDPSHVPIPLTIEVALALTQQVLAVHEYTHIILYGRHPASYEDFVTPMSFYVTGVLYGGSTPTKSLCESRWNVENSGKLFHDLCVQIGLDFGDLAESLIELDAAYQAHPDLPASIFVYRRILTELKHADMAATFQTYLQSGFDPNVIGDTATITPAGGIITMFGGNVTLEVEPNAVASPLFIDNQWPVEISDYSQPTAWYDFEYSTTYWFVGRDDPPITLAKPARLTIHYDPARLPAGVAQSSLRLYLTLSNPRQEVPESTVDTVAHTVSAMVSTLDRYAIEPMTP